MLFGSVTRRCKRRYRIGRGAGVWWRGGMEWEFALTYAFIPKSSAVTLSPSPSVATPALLSRHRREIALSRSREPPLLSILGRQGPVSSGSVLRPARPWLPPVVWYRRVGHAGAPEENRAPRGGEGHRKPKLAG